jgi:hypothetical protein
VLPAQRAPPALRDPPARAASTLRSSPAEIGRSTGGTVLLGSTTGPSTDVFADTLPADSSIVVSCRLFASDSGAADAFTRVTALPVSSINFARQRDLDTAART